MSKLPRSKNIELYEAVCSNRLDDEMQTKLEETLRNSAQAREEYLDYLAMHADISSVISANRVREELIRFLDSESADDKPLVASNESTEESLTSSSSLMRIARGTVASAFVIAATLLISFSLRPSSSSVNRYPSPENSFASWRGLVATINRIDSAEWDQSARQYDQADLVAAGEIISITSGIVEIEFRQGAVVVLEGPAKLIAEDPNGVTLLHGKLAAVAPPWATGFRVDTPGLDVIDHGTEFAVNVFGDELNPLVNVVVTEGEVEILPVNQAELNLKQGDLVDAGQVATSKVEGGRRLTAGQGVRSSGIMVEEGDDPLARELTEQLPNNKDLKNAVVVADRWHDWTTGVEGEPNTIGGWRYYTNATHRFGMPSHYSEMLWDGKTKSYRPGNHATDESLKYVRAHSTGGHPGKGSSQISDEIDRYSITGFVVPESGIYRIEAGWLERLWARRWDQDKVLDIAVHVNDGPLLQHHFCNHDCFVSFQGSLGKLETGDIIYVGVGPNGIDHNDRFRWSYNIVREIDEQISKVAKTD